MTIRRIQLPIQWTFNGHGTFLHDMGVDHGGADILVPEQLLNGADVVTVFKQVGGKAVAKGVAGDRFGNAGQANGPFERPLKGAGVNVRPAFDAAARIF